MSAKLFFKSKDGGKESSVTGYWLIEWKEVFSIVLLKFEGKSRAAYHTHAFDAFSWVLNGTMVEYFKDNYKPFRILKPSVKPFITTKDDFHMVSSLGTSWALTFRGRWDKTWLEHTQKDNTYILTNGRIRVK